MMQIGVRTTSCQEEGILLQKHRDKNVRCIAIFFNSVGSGVDLTLFPDQCRYYLEVPSAQLEKSRMKFRKNFGSTLE